MFAAEGNIDGRPDEGDRGYAVLIHGWDVSIMRRGSGGFAAGAAMLLGWGITPYSNDAVVKGVWLKGSIVLNIDQAALSRVMCAGTGVL